MHIAIDSSPMETGHALRGVGSYTKNLIGALQKYEHKHSYSLFTRGQKVPDNADLVHYPYFDPFFLTLPLVKTKPTVVTVHDLIPLVFPDKFPKGIKGAMKWHIQKASLKGARRIITDSESSKSDISKITRIKESHIDVVYLAPDVSFTGAFSGQPSIPYFLYVGDVNWNKNVPGLLRAFANIPYGELMLVGDAFVNTALPETKAINSLVSSLGIEKRITRTGYVSNKKLAELYARATALVLPSYYEGFGLPVLEAMACRCPVVSTLSGSLNEIAGSAIDVQPNRVDSITNGMKRVLALSVDARKKLVEEGDRWVKKFTWRKTARETTAIYEKIVNYHSGI